MSDFDRLVHLQWALFSVFYARVPGSIVEIGCNNGFTSAFIGLVMKDQNVARPLHLYDSFKGLPSPSEHDTYFKQGELLARPEHVAALFEDLGLTRPFIHQGWFEDTLPHLLPDCVAFAYVDADFYHSTKHALASLYPRSMPGGIIIVDDYCDREKNPRAWDAFAGVKRACDEVTTSWDESFQVLCATNELAFGLLCRGLD
jgi:O-methyltransferase